MMTIDNLSLLKTYLSKSNNRTAILFTGAGFSYGAQNIKGETPKDSRSLSREICKLCDIDEDDDLYYSSDYCLDTKPHHELINLLKAEYTIQKVSKSHEIIARKQWRRVYTTNYDRVFEIASNNCSNICESVNISSPPSNFSQKNQCVHLNGSIEDLTHDSLSDNFKLTDSSYVSPDTLNISKWKSTFQIDIEYSSAIFFVGYSMYDLDIKRILKNDINIKSKTFFIVKPGEEEKEKYKLSKYGTVLDIGIEKFAEIVSEVILDDVSMEFDNLECFKIIRTIESVQTPTDTQIIDLFIKGSLIEDELYSSVTSQSHNYLVKRVDLEKNTNFVARGHNLMVIGDIACGKTIYSKQLSSILAHQGKDVFFLSNEDGDYQRDLAIITETSTSPIFVIDNAFRHEDIIKNLYSVFGKRATFILSGRTEFVERTKIELAKIDLEFIEEEIDVLSNEEIKNLNQICNYIGFWGINNSWSNERKEKYLSVDCEGKFSTILLEFFKSEYVRGIFEKHFSELKDKKSKTREVIFIILILGLLPFFPRKSLVSDLCRNEHIYGRDFKESEITKTLICFNGGNVEIASGILSKFILQNYFSGREIVDEVIKIISHFDTIKNHNSTNNSIFKELLRFKNINFMLPDENRGSNLNTFFNNLKSIIKWMERSPHFWLQYGMATMFIKDYPRAKQYFENAYGSSSNDPHYDTKYIDNQMARWHLEYGQTKVDPQEIFDHLNSAYKLLSSQDIDYYFCKQARLIEPYYEFSYKNFTNKHKAEFGKICNNLKQRFEKNKIFLENHNVAYTAECETMFKDIVEGIKKNNLK